MLEEIIIAGFGGQGVLSMGMTLSYAGMLEDKEISWMPSYGPEMRGGTANCITIISDSKISSPIISEFDTAIILNQPSMDKFESRIKEGGLLIYESTNIREISKRKDIEIIGIPAAQEALNMKNGRILNMIMLGAFLEKRPVVKIESIIEALKKVLPERYHNTLPLNREALERGASLTEIASGVLS
ncbi:MAG TPA: 2-oxoacid:acceptor oxidoreductase family protein [Ignavibacteria bacterium]|nr:2-oxoacid:ferredoxin oxidoreductase subunit gamma [Bacteroidota bacterium]HRI85473.1 2-oxoacid:acceptor oxidoreductase family protein [Ignavibacteria bacterium]HRK00776.1 2-oxoacid:acceptor oxidoreductase family protein [Ignavibacteria bacterium]